MAGSMHGLSQLAVGPVQAFLTACGDSQDSSCLNARAGGLNSSVRLVACMPVQMPLDYLLLHFLLMSSALDGCHIRG